MKKIHHQIYTSVVAGIGEDVGDAEILHRVNEQYGAVSAKRMVKSLLVGFSDPDLRDPDALSRLAALAVKYRTGEHDSLLKPGPVAVGKEEEDKLSVPAAETAQLTVAEETPTLVVPDAARKPAKARRKAKTGPGEHGQPSTGTGYV